MGDKKYETIAIHPYTKERFKKLKDYKMTDDEFLSKLMNAIEGKFE